MTGIDEGDSHKHECSTIRNDSTSHRLMPVASIVGFALGLDRADSLEPNLQIRLKRRLGS